VSADPNETVPVLIKMRAELLEAMDASLAPLGYQDRSRFVRDAIVEKARLAPALALMTSRKGVGGTPSHKRTLARNTPFPVTPPHPADVTMNDGPASSTAAGRKVLGFVREKIERRRGSGGTAPGAPGSIPPPSLVPPKPPANPRS
jgi:hypothetical protein